MANLLPTKELGILAQERRRRFVRALLVLAGGVFAFGIASLIPSAVAALTSLDAVSERLETTKRLVELQKDAGAGDSIRATKEKMELLRDIESSTSAHDVIELVVRAVPAGVTLQSIALIHDGADTIAFDIVGLATTRNALLSFGDTLRSTGLFADVTIPIEALSQNTDLSFRLTLMLEDGATE